MDTVGFPKLIWFDVDDILVDRCVLAELEFVLVGQDLNSSVACVGPCTSLWLYESLGVVVWRGSRELWAIVGIGASLWLVAKGNLFEWAPLSKSSIELLLVMHSWLSCLWVKEHLTVDWDVFLELVKKTAILDVAAEVLGLWVVLELERHLEGLHVDVFLAHDELILAEIVISHLVGPIVVTRSTSSAIFAIESVSLVSLLSIAFKLVIVIVSLGLTTLLTLEVVFALLHIWSLHTFT